MAKHKKVLKKVQSAAAAALEAGPMKQRKVRGDAWRLLLHVLDPLPHFLPAAEALVAASAPKTPSALLLLRAAVGPQSVQEGSQEVC
jgi:hypothetical protein